jgi:hypothetical protein
MEAMNMFKKYRQLIIGFAICLLFVVVPVGAAVNEYTLKQSECKIVVDGKEVKGELPLLIMDPGFNYIAAAEFRSICDKIGIDFEFDPPTKEIRITTRQDVKTMLSQSAVNEKESEGVSEVITQTPDGLEVFQYEGEKYIRWSKLRAKCESLGLKFDAKNNYFNIKNDDTLLCSLPLYTIYSAYDSVKYSDYLSIALPLLGAS